MRPLISATIAATALALASAGIQARGWSEDFTAEMVMTNPKNTSQQKTAKFYSSKGRTRTESGIPASRAKKQGMGKHQVQIVNPYQGSLWLVFPDVKKYMESTGEPATELPAPLLPGDADHPCNKPPADEAPKLSCKDLGAETIGGRATEKWDITATGEKGSLTTTLWFDAELGVPVRELVPDKLMREMRNIEVGPLDEGLFEAPAGYEKVTPPEESPGMPEK